jgi:hypothetical protein
MLAVIGVMPVAERVLSEVKLSAPSAPSRRGPYRADGFWVWPLRTRGGDLIGALAAIAGEAPATDLPLDLSEEEDRRLEELARQAAIALEDRRLQEDVFDAVEHILPEIDVIQRRRGAQRYVGSPPPPPLEGTLAADAEFFNQVKDALSHMWGGPKLTTSPLLRMAVVDQALRHHNGNAPKALRAVLVDAIAQLRPDGPHSLTAAEWLLYNILEMRFVKGERVRDIARKLAMSESDLYRKQRLAIEAVARMVVQMEQRALEGADSQAGPE